MKRNKRTRYPSQEKYDRKMPTVSFRLSQKDHQKVKEIAVRRGCPISTIFKEALHLVAKEYKEYKQGYNAGYEKGNNKATDEWQIWYYCSVCGEPIDFSPNSNSHEALIEYMKEHGWGHSKCIDEN
jgi:CRISPR/Cas system-associated protein Cas10 (large subunit of type III CRISPR-Cas system)